ncbi:MAG: ABC transporter substrate-binding protein [Clostridia bacterium]|nr:ABC transporter substrate-binding protein [Clostridia bacterium]
MKKLTALFLAVLMLTACTAKNTENTATQEGYPVTVKNYDREVTVNKTPEKVLTLGPNCTELFVALGLGDKIAGTSLKNHSRGPLPEYAEIYKDIPEMNYGSATREAVISSGADFIYGIDWEFGESNLDIAELKSYGMSVYKNSATTVDEQYREILDIGKLFGIKETAQKYVDDQKSRISAVGDKVKNLDKPNVLVYDSGNDGVFTCSGINFESQLISLAGGKNIFDDLKDKQWVTVSYEEIIKRKPDVIVIHDYDSPSVEEKIAEIKANKVLSQLDCVKNERFVVIDLESVLPGNRIAYTVEKLSKGFFSDKKEE